MQTKEGNDKKIHSFMNMGISSENSGNYQFARMNYNAAIRLIRANYSKKDSVEIMCRTGISLYSKEIYEGSRYFQLRVLETDPNNLAANIELATICKDREEEDESEKYYNNTIEKRDSPDEWIKYAKMLKKADRHNEFIVIIEIAARLHRQEVISMGIRPSMPVSIKSRDIFEDKIEILKGAAKGPTSYEDIRKDVFNGARVSTWAGQMEEANPIGEFPGR